MGLWTILGAMYLATYVMMMARTYSICIRMIRVRDSSNIMIIYNKLGFIVFSIGLFFLVPLIPKVAFSNRARKSFCIGYVNSLTKENK
jgi:hypothetical protein